ncbi:AMP-binding protein, partial [Brevibacterium aurantiacum]
VLGGFEHQAAPFEEITRVLGTERAEGRNPVFQIMLTHQVDNGEEPSVLTGCDTVESAGGELGAVKTDIDLYTNDAPDTVRGMLSYSTEVFDAATVDRFITVFNRVLNAFAADLTVSVADLDLLPHEELEHLDQWATGDDLVIPAGVTLDSLLRDQAAATPDAVAVVSDDGQELTYDAFDSRVNQLARLLTNRGVVVGGRVAVVLPRSVDLVTALTSAIRAGAAYVPIDPNYPSDRVGYILTDSHPHAIITDQVTADTHVAVLDQARAAGVDIVVIDDDVTRAELAALPDHPLTTRELSRPLTPADAAYVIYTSGTTGRPKGVTVRHEGVVNRLVWGRAELRLDEESVTVWKSGVGFVDASTELFTPLMAGSTVIVAGEEAASDPQLLAGLIARYRVSHLLTVPSLAGSLAEAAASGTGVLDSVRVWTSSGEALTRAQADAMYAVAPGAVIRNFYGSTEVVGDGTHTAVTSTGAITIGRPVANTTVRVLDSWLRPVPTGVIGELYLGGAQLADGYIGRHD